MAASRCISFSRMFTKLRHWRSPDTIKTNSEFIYPYPFHLVHSKYISSSCNSRKHVRTPTQVENEIVAVLDSDHALMGLKKLQEAVELAREKDMSLIRLSEHGDETLKYPIYQIVSNEQAKSIKPKKPIQHVTEKEMFMTDKITDHDLATKLKTARKWIDKGYMIRVGINGAVSREQKLEELYNRIEETFKGEVRFLQKRIKNGHLKFTIQEPKKKTKESKETDDDRQNDGL